MPYLYRGHLVKEEDIPDIIGPGYVWVSSLFIKVRRILNDLNIHPYHMKESTGVGVIIDFDIKTKKKGIAIMVGKRKPRAIKRIQELLRHYDRVVFIQGAKDTHILISALVKEDLLKEK